MGFDDGYNPDMTAEEDFSYKITSLLHQHNMKFEQLVGLADVDYSTAHEAIMRGADGLPATSETLQKLLAVFRIGLDYLLNPNPGGPRTPEEERQNLRDRAWQFCRRYDVPRHHCIPFVNHVLSLLDTKPTHTMQLAARWQIPHGMLGFVSLYEQLRRDGHFGS